VREGYFGRRVESIPSHVLVMPIQPLPSPISFHFDFGDFLSR
jgi:hypothetical protein